MMLNQTLLQADLLSMNVSWLPRDLEPYNNQSGGFLLSLTLTIARAITFFIAVIVHRAFYRFMNRLPGRPINQMIYPHMVSTNLNSLSVYFCTESILDNLCFFLKTWYLPTWTYLLAILDNFSNSVIFVVIITPGEINFKP